MAPTSSISQSPMCRERVTKLQLQEEHAACVFPNQTRLLVSRFLAKYVAIGDEIAFPIPTGDTVGAEILITKSATLAPGRYLYETPIGYVSQPKQDKRNQHFVSAEVQGGSLGIATLFLPCEVLREYFYRLPRTDSVVERRTLYDILRIPAGASPSELRVASKLRDLELKSADIPHS